MHAPVAAQLGPLLPWLDLFGIAVFAATGAIAAALRGQTFVTGAFFASVTGAGLRGAAIHWKLARAGLSGSTDLT